MKHSRRSLVALLGCVPAIAAMVGPAAAETRTLSKAEQANIIERVDAGRDQMRADALQIWDWAEVGFQEIRSSRALQERLERAGFDVQTNVANMPTAFVARFRRGKGPIIGLLAEFDALPGQSQAVAAARAPVENQDAGHACGHNLLGAGSVGAAIALKQWMIAQNVDGEIRVYGSPAEEGGSGKVYMVRAGLFDDVDAVLHWHPNDTHSAGQSRSLANISGKFRFHGRAAHAARAPEQGRSALDAVEAMNFMVNALREHIPQDARIHYAITHGGASPNVVPDFAEVYYYVRHVDPTVVRGVMERVQQAAAGAALGTGTTFEFEATGAVYSLLPNDTLGRLMDSQLRSAAGSVPSGSTKHFAIELVQSLLRADETLDADKVVTTASVVQPYAFDEPAYISTDVGDVSWVVPTAGVRAATWAAGTPAHSWQATAASGSELGFHGMVVASKAIALTAATLMLDVKLIEKARTELIARRGQQFEYQSLLGDRPPALDYRAK